MRFSRNSLHSAWNLLLALSALLIPAAAYAKDSVPDWVKTAMAEPTDRVGKEAKAVVLLDDTVFTVGADGKAVEHRRRVVKILRPAGRDFGYVFVPFDDDYKILSLHVWSVGPDGTEYALKDKDIGEIGEPNSGPLYSDQKAKVADPPGRDPGGVVAYDYVQRQASYRHEADWPFQSSIPTVRESYILELPPSYAYAATWAHHEALAGADIEHQKVRWELTSVPAVDLERVPMAPAFNAVRGRMAIHYGPVSQTAPALGTWQEVGDWYDQLARDRMVANADISAKAAELTAGKTDFYDKSEAIAEFVQKQIRYFVVEKGIGGEQPHPAADIFRNRYGDCKDKSTLLSAMLSSVGIRSIIVLVDSERGFIDPAAPSAAGNHAIAAIEIPSGYQNPKLRSVVTAKSGKHYLIVDPTWELTAFGQLEKNLQGGYGVLVDGKQSEAVQFPVLSPELNIIRRTATFDLQADGSLKGSITEKRFGDTSESVRYLYSNKDAKLQQRALDHRLSQDFTSFNVSDVKVEDVAALSKPVTTTFNLTAERYARVMGALLMVRPRVMGREGMELDQNRRVYPIDMEESRRAEDDFTIVLPEGYAVDEMPEAVKLDVGFASYESSTRLDAMHCITCARTPFATSRCLPTGTPTSGNSPR